MFGSLQSAFFRNICAVLHRHGLDSHGGSMMYARQDRTTSYEVEHRTRFLYSYSRMAQITYRDNCDLTHFGGEKGVQCAHRFMPSGKAFVTYGDRQKGFCCQSFGHLPQSNPLPIPHPSFMNTCLIKKGPVPYNGTYYQGPVYNYTDEFSELPTYFWYLTAADGSGRGEWPVEQGEGCVIDWSRRKECTAAGKTSGLGPRIGDPPPIKFEYETFTETVFADAEFDLPARRSKFVSSLQYSVRVPFAYFSFAPGAHSCHALQMCF